VPKGQHTMVAAALRQAFQQPDHAAARTALLHVAEMMRARWPKLATFIIDSEADVLAYTGHVRNTCKKLSLRKNRQYLCGDLNRHRT
jgi:transposase-like protein